MNGIDIGDQLEGSKRLETVANRRSSACSERISFGFVHWDLKIKNGAPSEFKLLYCYKAGKACTIGANHSLRQMITELLMLFADTSPCSYRFASHQGCAEADC